MRRLSLCLLATMVFMFCAGCGQQEQKKQVAADVVPVKAEKVLRQDLAEVLEYAATIKAQEEVQVYPKVTGKVIRKTKQEGDPVLRQEPVLFVDRDEVGLKFQEAPVESPLSGTVGRIYVDIGSSVGPQNPVAMVVDMDNIKISFDVPEIYLPQVSVGKKAFVQVDAYKQEEFSGEVSMVSPVVDPVTRTAPVEIMIPNPGHRLNPGMFARVKLVLRDLPQVLVILKEAILGKSPDNYVYVIKDGKAYFRSVRIGLKQGPYLQVIDGLTDEDSVVVMGQQRLYDAAPVSTE